MHQNLEDLIKEHVENLRVLRKAINAERAKDLGEELDKWLRLSEGEALSVVRSLEISLREMEKLK